MPHDIPLSAQFIPAPVPGTVAAALEKAGLFDRENPEPLNTRDAWYLCRLFDAEPGDAILRFAGLATLCHVFLNGQEILFSESMFTAHEIPVTLSGGDELALCFRALGAPPVGAGPARALAAADDHAGGLEEFPHDAARPYAGLVPRYPCRRAMAADFDGAASSRLDRQCLHPRRIGGEWRRPSQRVPA